MAKENTTERQAEVSPERHFLGWSSPILPQAVARLREQYADGSDWDLRGLCIVLPSSLACRRLQELLALDAEQRQLVLYPPKIITIGQLPELLYPCKKPFAGALVQLLAWTEVLRGAPSELLSKIVPEPPGTRSVLAWMDLARAIGKLHRELANDALDFAAVAQELAESFSQAHPDIDRWNALAKLQREFLTTLDKANLWDVHTARSYALEHDLVETRNKIIVLGCVDLRKTHRQFVQAMAESVEVWIGAPDSVDRLFDALGCVLVEQWQQATVDVPGECLLVGNSPVDQADLVVGCIADWEGRFQTRQMTLGVPDPELVPVLRSRFAQADIATRFGAGRPLGRSEPALLLERIADFLEQRTFAAFAALVRHPAVANLIRKQKIAVPQNWLEMIDQYYQEALPKRIDGFVHRRAKGSQVFQAVSAAIDAWLARLTKKSADAGSLVKPLLDVMAEAYDRIFCDPDDAHDAQRYAAVEQCRDAILELSGVPKALVPKITAVELIRSVLINVRGKMQPAAQDGSSLEMLGWLELALDDAPALIVSGMHDGVVPENVNADPFLPNQLRKSLGIDDNDRRFARDLYVTQVLMNSREECKIVVGRADRSGDPLTPSRVLLAGKIESLPSRVLHLVSQDQTDVLQPVNDRWQSTRLTTTSLPVPRPPENVTIPEKISVTAFREYLRCPYRFYLRHVLRLEPQDDALAELGARQFGVLIHDTLLNLQGEISTCTDAEVVSNFLIDELHRLSRIRYGNYPAAAVVIQVEQAEERLRAFAVQQAQRAAEGWEIRYCEQGSDVDSGVFVGKQRKLPLIGRIDRIDHRPATGEWAIWDYKTSETAKDPVGVHWTERQGWADLQLPLYLRVAELFDVSNPSLGYIALPKSSDDCGFHVAAFSDQQIKDALAHADHIADLITAGHFWPDELGEVAFDDFARICQTNVQQVTASPPVPRVSRVDERQLQAIDSDVGREANVLLLQPEVYAPELPPKLIRASAGTGKTFQLSNRLLEILLAGQDVDSILATTFTRKAAGEILHRVLERLAHACIEESACRHLAELLPNIHVTQPACLAALRRITSSIHRLRIATLDSFFSQVARALSLELDLPHGWEVMDPVQEPQLQMRAIGRMLDAHDRKTLLTLVRMLAKGESTRQVAEEIRRTVNAGYAVFRATSPEAWQQLRVPSAPSESSVESALQTLEQTKFEHRSIDPQLEKLHLAARTGNWESVVGHGIYRSLEKDEPTYYRKPLPGGLIAALELLAEKAASELLPIRRDQTKASFDALSAYDQQYRQIVNDQRVMSFSDVTHCLSQSSGNRPAPLNDELLNFRLDTGIRHLLLDEFQDTAADQWRILRPLAQSLSNSADCQRSFFCVGDTKQAIYGWRGGVAEVFDSLKRSLPNIQESVLQASYRSSPEVLNVVNEVFCDLPKHSEYGGCEQVAEAWSKQFPPHSSALTDRRGFVQLRNGPVLNADLSADERRAAMMEQAADEVAALVQKTSASIGILLRTNQDVAQMISLLRDREVPASQDGGNPLSDSAAVELLLSLLQLCDHPGDRVSEFHVRNSPLADALPTDLDAAGIAEWFRNLVHQDGLGQSLERVADVIVSKLSWWDQHRLKQMIQLAYQYEGRFTGRLREFVELVEQQRVALPSEAQVKVMTIHRSKGLEFDAVFLPDLRIEMHDSGSLLVMRGADPCEPPDGVLRYMNSDLQRLLPASWQAAFSEHKQRKVSESLCLLYVAMTRARFALYMTTTPKHGKSTQEFGSVLQSTLSDKAQAKEANQTLYERGDAEWYVQRPLKTSERSQVAARELGLVQTAKDGHKLGTNESADQVRGMKVTTPSQAAAQSDLVPLHQLFRVSDGSATVYGTAIHALFEQVEWLEDFQSQTDTLYSVVVRSVSADELRRISVERVVADFEEMLTLRSVRHALSRRRYVRQTPDNVDVRWEVNNERPVSAIINGRLLSGKIDRLVVEYRDGVPFSAEIIDFKTDQFVPEMTLLWLEDRVDQHRQQIAGYEQAVSKQLRIPVDRISSQLLMLNTDDLVRVEPAPTPMAGDKPATVGDG